MFYKQFSTITDILNPEFVESFDYWLATLPKRSQKNITASMVASQLGVRYTLAEAILKFAEKQEILKKQYLIRCPICDGTMGIYTKDQLAEILLNAQYCDNCGIDRNIQVENIYATYGVILKPNVSESEIAKAIENKLNQGEGRQVNFNEADSLLNDKASLYEAFYNPDESAYAKFKELREKLDLDYGTNTTLKGKVLENLALEIFKQIKLVKGTNEISTVTNQFDCTCISGFKTWSLSVFSYMFPYFLIECKNELKRKPDNNYCNKLLSIIDTNEAQLGIIIGRLDATKTCFAIAREHYLSHSKERKQHIIITLCDDDLKRIIDDRVNLLEYLEFKIFQLTANSLNSTYEMFRK